MQARQKMEQVKAGERHKGMQTGTGQVLEHSVLQGCHQTRLMQTKEWCRYPNRFRCLYLFFIPHMILLTVILNRLGQYSIMVAAIHINTSRLDRKIVIVYV